MEERAKPLSFGPFFGDEFSNGFIKRGSLCVCFSVGEACFAREVISPSKNCIFFFPAMYVKFSHTTTGGGVGCKGDVG